MSRLCFIGCFARYLSCDSVRYSDRCCSARYSSRFRRLRRVLLCFVIRRILELVFLRCFSTLSGAFGAFLGALFGALFITFGKVVEPSGINFLDQHIETRRLIYNMTMLPKIFSIAQKKFITDHPKVVEHSGRLIYSMILLSKVF